MNKGVLLSSVSIADWILPGVYMGHFGRVVWVKPPWARQIPDGTYELCVGKDTTCNNNSSGGGGHIR